MPIAKQRSGRKTAAEPKHGITKATAMRPAFFCDRTPQQAMENSE
jgi:hypothetical protein